MLRVDTYTYGISKNYYVIGIRVTWKHNKQSKLYEKLKMSETNRCEQS